MSNVLVRTTATKPGELESAPRIISIETESVKPEDLEVGQRIILDNKGWDIKSITPMSIEGHSYYEVNITTKHMAETLTLNENATFIIHEGDTLNRIIF